MVGILVSFSDGLFSGAMSVSGSVCNNSVSADTIHVNPNPWTCRKPLTKRFKQEILAEASTFTQRNQMFFQKMFGPPFSKS